MDNPEQSDISANAPRAAVDAAEVTRWLLEGRFFTVDARGAVTMWSPPAADTFGWSRRDIVGASFTDTLVAPADRTTQAERVTTLLAGDGRGGAFAADVQAVRAGGEEVPAEFAAVPIHVAVGYEFNAILNEVASSSRTARSLAQLKARDEAVRSLIDDAVSGRHADLGDSEEARRLAGALVVFRTHAAPAAAAVASEAAAADAHLAAVRAQAEADAARTRMDEAIAEAERLRAELAAARERAQTVERTEAELVRAHEELAAARAQSGRHAGEVDAARAQLEAIEAQLSELSAEAAAARTEGERVRAELEALREAEGATVARLNAELAARDEQASAARTEIARLGGELDGARARTESIQNELSALGAEAAAARANEERLRGELERTAAASADAAGEVSQAPSAELDAARSRGEAMQAQLAALSAELAQLRADGERARAELDRALADKTEAERGAAVAREEAARVAAELETAGSELAGVRAQLERGEEQRIEAERAVARVSAELDTARAHGAALEGELAALNAASAEARAGSERKAAELERTRGELAVADERAEQAVRTLHERLEERDGELDRVRAARAESDAAAAASAAELARVRVELEATQAEIEASRQRAERAAAAHEAELASLTAELERARCEVDGVRERMGAAAAAAPVQGDPQPMIRPAGIDHDLWQPGLVPEGAARAPEPVEECDPITIDELHAIGAEVDAKNRYTGGHRERVAAYAVAIAESLGCAAERIDAIRDAALLHDVGKSRLPDELVAKDEPLNLEELDEVERHSSAGRAMLAAAGVGEIADWVYHLHERFDGGGYPTGLAGAEIPEESRILHAADALDHMTRSRAYRKHRPLREALAELSFCAGTRIDPDIAARVVELVERDELQLQTDAKRSIARG